MGFSGNGGGNGSIAGSSDASISNPTSDNFLTYDGGVAKWTNSPLATNVALPYNGGIETLFADYSASGPYTLDLASGNAFRLTLTGNITFTFTGAVNNAVCSFTLYMKQDSTGGRTVTWPAGVVWPGGIQPTLTTTPGSTDILVFDSITGGTSWYGSLVGSDYK